MLMTSMILKNTRMCVYSVGHRLRAQMKVWLAQGHSPPHLIPRETTVHGTQQAVT